jgi:hypothetical protein
MLGSTMGIAAAASYPAPFVKSGAADVSIVVGAASPANVDLTAATNLGSSLSDELASQSTGGTSSSGTTASGGDSVLIDKGTNKLNMQDALTDVWTTKVTDNDMPNLLADGTFRSKDNVDYAYEQYIELSSTLNFTHFDDDDYKEDTPTLGMRLDSSTWVLNYTIDFKKYPRSDVDSNGRLEDIQDRDITIMGNTYKLLNAYNASTDTKLELMKGTATENINLNEEITTSVEDSSYTVTLTYVDTTYAQFEVIDSEGTSQSTTKLSKGSTYKLSDGTQLGVTDISYQAFSGGVMSAEFTLGASKLTLENGQALEMDDVDINEIIVGISRTEVAANQVDITKIILSWTTDDEEFVADDSNLVLPGFESIKMSYGGFVTPCEETVTVKNTGTYGIELNVPIKDGDAKFTILNGNATDFLYVADDTDGTGILRTSNETAGTKIVFDKDTDDYFVASWNDSTSSESYLLKVTTITEDTSVKTNYTTIENAITGDQVTQKKQDDTITLGNIELTVGPIDKAAKSVEFTIASGGTFNRIYTNGGLGIWLPINATGDESKGADGGDYSVVFNVTNNFGATYPLIMSEEDRNGNLGSGAVITATLDQTGSSSKAEPNEVSPSTGFSAGTYKEIGETDEYEGYVISDLGTRVLFKQPTSGENELDIIYHCEESYGEIYITSPDTVIAPSDGEDGVELGSVTYNDNELTDAAKAKNLVVVGGSCINTVAAELLGGSYCAAEFTSMTGVGADQFLVQVFDNPYKAGKIAMLVAGYEAADTQKAVTYVTKEAPSTDVGTTLKKVTATYADVA